MGSNFIQNLFLKSCPTFDGIAVVLTFSTTILLMLYHFLTFEYLLKQAVYGITNITDGVALFFS